MRVLVAHPVAEGPCALVVGIAQVRRHLAHGAVAHVLPGVPDGQRRPVALRRGGQVDGRLAEVQLCLRQAGVLHRLGRGHSRQQGHRVGQADVLAGEDDHPPGDEAGVLPRLQHPGQVVDGRLRVAAAHALDERADDVVVVVAAVPQGAGAQRGLHVLQFHPPGVGQRARHLQSGQHLPPVAAGPVGEMGDGLRRGVPALGLQPAGDQGLDVRLGQRLQPEQGAAAAQRRVDLEERVLRRGADQRQRAVLHRWQQGVLLGLGEAVDLVEEQDRAAPMLTQPVARPLDDLAHVLDPRRHGAELLERPLGAARHGEGERGLSRAGRAPEDGAGQPVLLHQAA